MIIPKAPPGHVRALIECRGNAALANAARALLSGEDASRHMEIHAREFRSSGVVIDPSFGAIPIGGGADSDDFRALVDADGSKKFLVRGFVEIRSGEVPERVDGELVHSDPLVDSLLQASPPTCGSSRSVGDTDTVRVKLDTQTLWRHKLNGSGVAVAIVDSGIYLPRLTQPLGAMKPGATPKLDAPNSWKWQTVTEPGMHRLGHGTMCAYDALIAAPEASLLDIAMLIARPVADHTAQATVSAAILAYFHLLNAWISGRIQAHALVVSNSWGIFHPSLDEFPPTSGQRFIDNDKHIFRLFIRALTAAGADVLFCGNNCGSDCPSGTCLSKTDRMIMGANTYPEVLTVGGCDVNDDHVGYSSLGPSIAKMFQEKPDLTAYTHFLGSKSRRIYLPDTGVSAACPVAAGCVAALRTAAKPTQLSPAQLFRVLKATARAGNGIGPGGTWNPTFGYGIINPVAAARSLGLIP